MNMKTSFLSKNYLFKFHRVAWIFLFNTFFRNILVEKAESIGFNSSEASQSNALSDYCILRMINDKS